MQYFLSKYFEGSFDEAASRVTELLAQQGFGILTEIDIKATMKTKLDLDFRPYRILGSCNPALAREAIEAEPQIGALMPCNWTIQQDEEGRIEVSVMNPASLSQITGNAALQRVQERVLASVNAVLDEL
ncbi:DUF302 domain-containing protein [bacterium]|nr:DUF302 domain-containing protein [bacterium]